MTGERGIMNLRQVALTKAWTRGEDREPLGGNRALVLLDLPASQPDPPRVFYCKEAMKGIAYLQRCAQQRKSLHHGLEGDDMWTGFIVRVKGFSYVPPLKTRRLAYPSQTVDERPQPWENQDLQATERSFRVRTSFERGRKETEA